MISNPMMLLLNTEDVQNHPEIRRSVQDIASAGFDAVALEFRHSEYNEFDEIGQAAMRTAYDEARRQGIGFIKIMPHMYEGFFQKHPEMKRRHIAEKRVSFRSEGEQCLPWERSQPQLLRAFEVTRDEEGVICAVHPCTGLVQWSCQDRALTVRVHEPGEYLLYFSYEVPEVDYANPGTAQMIDDFLAVYDAYELNGFAIDEFGAGSHEEGVYLGNESFLERFRRNYGYDFADKLYLMHERTHGTDFAKVRYDYFALTVDITYDYQMAARRKFTHRYGPDIFIGFHHTWFGEGNSGDLWAGNIDYFKLAQVLSGGFVDAQYDAERTMLSMTALAESLAKYAPTNAAYNMCWDRFATPKKMDYYQRMLAVRDVNWLGHALAKGINRTIPKGCYHTPECPGAWLDKITGNPHWADPANCIRRAHSLHRFLGGAHGTAQVAVLYIWESTAYFNNDYMHYHRLSLKALLDKLLQHNIPVDVVPSTENDLSQYDVLFALWPAMMPPELWETLKREIARGKTVYFMGPPAYVTTDGADISAQFESIIGKKVESRNEYCGGHEYPQWDLWFTDRVIHSVTYCNDEYPIEQTNGNVHYYGYDAPLTEAMFDIIDELSKYRTINSTSVISKVFRDDTYKILTLTARWSSRINECFVFEGNVIDIRGGLLVGIKCRDGKVVDIVSEGDAGITVNGERYDCRAL